MINRGSLCGELLAAIKQQTREGSMLNGIDGGWASSTGEVGVMPMEESGPGLKAM